MKIKQHIPNILRDYANNMTVVDLAKKYGVTEININRLLNGDSYKGIGKVKEKDYRSAGKPVLLKINRTVHRFNSVRKLAKFLGLSESHTNNILAGREKIPVIEEITYE